MKSKKTYQLVLTALFTAIIILMASIPVLGYIPLGVIRATTIHIPVIIGAILLGPKSGAFLGFVFGLTSLISNTYNPTITSFVFSPFYSVEINGQMIGGNFWSLVICFVPRILVGIAAYYVYRLIRKIIKGQHKFTSRTLALATAGVIGSLVNTLLVMNGIFLLFGDSYAQAKEIASDALYGVILGVIGTNGVPEAIVAGVLVAAIGTVLLKIKPAS